MRHSGHTGWRSMLAAVAVILGSVLAGCGDAPQSTGGTPENNPRPMATAQSTGSGAAQNAAGSGPAGTDANRGQSTPATGGTGTTAGSGSGTGTAAPTPPTPAPTTSNAKGVFVVSDIYTIMVDGRVSERTDGKFGGLSKQNSHFDGVTNTIRLYGAQNQEVAAQIVIPWTGKNFSAQADKFDGIPAENINFSWIAYDQIQREPKAGEALPPPTYLPDVIVPLNGSINGIRSFNVPQALAGLPTVDNKQGMMLMEVWIPKTLAPGLHTGSIRVLEGDSVAAVLNVQVQVHAVALTDQPIFRMDYLTYGSPLKGFGKDSNLGDGASTDLKTTPEGIKLEQSIYALTLDNRGFLNILPYSSQRGNAQYAYPVAGSGAEAKISSFKGFDERFGDLLSGKIGKYRVPPGCFTLAFNINYPYTSMSDTGKHFDFRPFHKTIPEGPGKDEKLKTWEDTNRAIGQQTLTHFAEMGWKNTAFEIYSNQKPADNNRSPWKLDEPVEAADYKGLRYLYTVGKWAFEGAEDKGVKIVTRVDIGHWECDRMHTLDGKITQCYKAKEFNTGHAQKVIGPVIDRWVAGHTHIHGSQHLIPEYNTDKVMFDNYGGASANYAHGSVFAGLGWVCSHLGVEGKVIYKAGFESPDAVDGVTTLFTAKGMGAEAALVSRRVKLWRNAVNDYDLLAQAKAKDPAAVKALFGQVVKLGAASDQKYREDSKTIETYFTNNVEDLVVAQRMAAAIAAGQKIDVALKLEGFSKDFSPAGAPDEIVGYD